VAIIGLQQQQTEVGRIRLGMKVKTKNGREAPAKLDRLRFTSPRMVLIEKIAELYGGKVEEWTPPRGSGQWQVITNATEVPVLIPPQDPAESQWYEMWSAGGCQRRCDGQTEKITNQACLCDPEARGCKMHTRLRVMLEDVPGLGAWRVDTGSYYAAVELPGVAALLAMAQGAIPGRLVLAQRTVTRDGKTMNFVVPEIHAEEITPGQLVSGKVHELIAARRALAVDVQVRQAIEAGVDYPSLIEAARTLPALYELHGRLAAKGEVPEDLLNLFNARANAIRSGETPAAKPVVIDAEVAEPDEVDALWADILAASPWDGADELEQHFCEFVGRASDEASVDDMRRFLASLTAERVA
jgi:hypothetical protein